jgi:hypothetical protein
MRQPSAPPDFPWAEDPPTPRPAVAVGNGFLTSKPAKLIGFDPRGHAHLIAAAV